MPCFVHLMSAPSWNLWWGVGWAVGVEHAERCIPHEDSWEKRSALASSPHGGQPGRPLSCLQWESCSCPAQPGCLPGSSLELGEVCAPCRWRGQEAPGVETGPLGGTLPTGLQPYPFSVFCFCGRCLLQPHWKGPLHMVRKKTPGPRSL